MYIFYIVHDILQIKIPNQKQVHSQIGYRLQFKILFATHKIHITLGLHTKYSADTINIKDYGSDISLDLA